MLRPMAKQLLLGDVDRNDPEAALAFAEQEADAGTLSPEVARILFMLQDEPDAYARAVERWVEKRLADGKPVGPFRSTE